MLLKTKLFVPRLQSQLVARSHLLDRLQKGIDKKLTLVSASAGFGKTTLIAHWLSQVDHPFAWFSIDTNDNTFTVFISYFAGALDSIEPGLGSALLPLQQPKPQIATEVAIQTLINDLIAYDKPVVLVLDDYHYIETTEIHEMVNFLLDHLPANAHLVIASRTDPPFSLARLRMQRGMTEIRAEQLRFSLEENQCFFNDVMQFDLSKADLLALQNRTEGWIATLCLAALSLMEVTDKQKFIHSFTGSDRYLVDYLMEEVLNHLPETTRAFLRQTSILNRFCGDLCLAVTGPREHCQTSQETQTFLQQLEQHNLFLVPLDNERKWYRYHHLFGAFLQQQLLNEHPEQVAELHKKASEWFEQQELVEEAIHHAFAANDLDHAAEMILVASKVYLVRQEAEVVLRWLTQLPEAYYKKLPRLCVAYGWTAVFLWKMDELEKILQIGINHADKSAEGYVKLEIAVIQCFVEMFERDFEVAIDKCRYVIDQLQENNDEVSLFIRALAYAGIVAASHIGGDRERVSIPYEEAATLNLQCNNPAAYFSTVSTWAQELIFSGKLHKAMGVLQQSLQVEETMKKKHALFYVGDSPHIHLAMTEICYKQNRLEDAELHIQVSIQSLERNGGLGFVITRSYYLMGLLQKAKGNLEQVLYWLKKLESYRLEIDIKAGPMMDWTSELIMRLKMGLMAQFNACRFFEKDIEVWCDQMAKQHNGMIQIPLDYTCVQASKVYLRFLLEQGRYEEVESKLVIAIDLFQKNQRLGDLIDFYVLQASLFRKTGRLKKAIHALEQALLLAEPESIIRPFADWDIHLGRLLQQIPTSKISKTFLASLYETFPEATLTPKAPNTLETVSEAIPLQKTVRDSYEAPLEPLKEREMSILRALNGPLNNTEIAKELYLSVNTVRWYVKSIYSKLGVNSRREAVERAIELGIL